MPILGLVDHLSVRRQTEISRQCHKPQLGHNDTDSDTKPLRPGSVQKSGDPAAVAPA